MLSSQKFKHILSKTSVGFCLLAKECVILEINDSFKKASKIKSPIGKKLSDIITTEGDLDSFLKEILTEGYASFEVNFNGSDNPFFAIANATLISEEGEEAQIAILFTGINQWKLLEYKLEERITQELKKNREKDEMMNQQAKLATMGEMIGNIAHQWRQPINILALIFQDIYIKYQLNALDAEQMEKNYEKVNNLVQYMSQTIDDFRTFFKSEDGDAPFSAAEALNSVFELIGTRFAANNTQCNINISSEAIVQGTENGFKQVIINLLNNAQEAITTNATKKGLITVDLSQEKKMLVVKVSDNGGGISQEIMNQVFEPYFTTKHQTQGTGLGLYMSKQIIEHHMVGKLEVENSKEGAEFKISLPILE